MRGSGKSRSRALYQGYQAHMQVFDDVEDDPMSVGTFVVRRAYIKQEVLCAVLVDNSVVHFEGREGFNAAEYAKQAFAKFGKCRVIFYQANDGKVWREVRWKNATVGTLYKRPSFLTLGIDKVPDELQVATMMV